MKDKLFKYGTLLLALIGISGSKVDCSENIDVKKTECISKIEELTPLYLDEAMSSLDNNTILAWHSSHRSHASHFSHASHYSSKF